jgi:hypothetical protein
MRLPWLLVFLAAGAGVWFYNHPDHFGQLRDLIPVAGPEPGTTRLYKWRNPRGEWQMTDTPPPPGTSFERLEYRNDLNVLPVPPRLERER